MNSSSSPGRAARSAAWRASPRRRTRPDRSWPRSDGQDRERVGRDLPVDRAPTTPTASRSRLAIAPPLLALDGARVGMWQSRPLGFKLLSRVEHGSVLARRPRGVSLCRGVRVPANDVNVTLTDTRRSAPPCTRRGRSAVGRERSDLVRAQPGRRDLRKRSVPCSGERGERVAAGVGGEQVGEVVEQRAAL
jgi:hypothetical protein